MVCIGAEHSYISQAIVGYKTNLGYFSLNNLYLIFLKIDTQLDSRRTMSCQQNASILFPTFEFSAYIMYFPYKTGQVVKAREN